MWAGRDHPVEFMASASRHTVADLFLSGILISKIPENSWPEYSCSTIRDENSHIVAVLIEAKLTKRRQINHFCAVFMSSAQSCIMPICTYVVYVYPNGGAYAHR